MKIEIEIPKEMYQNVLNGTYCGTLYEALKNGTPHETVTDFADRCKECGKTIKQKYTDEVLDKIRAEIEQTYMNITYQENHKVGGAWGLRKALEIIDKYKAESEVSDADSD